MARRLFPLWPCLTNSNRIWTSTGFDEPKRSGDGAFDDDDVNDGCECDCAASANIDDIRDGSECDCASGIIEVEDVEGDGIEHEGLGLSRLKDSRPPVPSIAPAALFRGEDRGWKDERGGVASLPCADGCNGVPKVSWNCRGRLPPLGDTGNDHTVLPGGVLSLTRGL